MYSPRPLLIMNDNSIAFLFLAIILENKHYDDAYQAKRFMI